MLLASLRRSQSTCSLAVEAGRRRSNQLAIDPSPPAHWQAWCLIACELACDGGGGGGDGAGINSKCVVLASLFFSRVVIPAEHVGIAWVNGKPEILEPGVHQRSCTTFSYSPRNDQSLMDKELVLGPFRIVTVNEDEVGIKFRNRRPSVLYRGRYVPPSVGLSVSLRLPRSPR